MQELKEFGLEFLAIVALVFIVVLLQKIFEYYFKRKMGE
ncbi:hypothetical protein SAMN05660197_1697 [Nitratiruptor tergarcus DSM 16512]|uniref:Uncharacterized protein n=1 Tax=Nitratiruptor tergarcus DSM 16512 TaxID=1069081 RepID=A0A1W1WUJ6_9BACT|nr:hypothetical protein SAMN05660197_1697 [Nitratiruptor tergarcus DSM 16512]